MTNDTYLEAHKNLRGVVTHCGRNLTLHKSLVELTLKEDGITLPNNDEKEAATTKVKEV